MALRYFFHIGYNGFNYKGWQKLPQTRGADVQSVIEKSLGKILKKNVGIVGCGRTDGQVHASQFFFHIDVKESWDYDLVFRLNKNLPDDIAVFDIIPMEATTHARFDAIERTYNYFIHTYKDPFLSNISSFYVENDLKLDEMRKAVALLSRYDDYTAFCKNLPKESSKISKVTRAELFVNERGNAFRFEISANRFLSAMVRIIVQRLIMIGRGDLSVDEFESYLVNKKGPTINTIAYPQGLYLSRVRYPYLDLPTRSEFLMRLL